MAIGCWDCGLKADSVEISRRRALVRQFLGSPLLFGYVTPMFLLIPVSVVLPQLGDSTHPLDRIGEFAGGLAFIWLILGLVVSAGLVVANHALMVVDPKGRGWHDKLVETVVLREIKQDNH